MAMDKKYAIAFDTKEFEGRVVMIEVTLNKRLMTRTEKAALDLCDHPLYHHLQEYCRNNPPGGKPKSKGPRL